MGERKFEKVKIPKQKRCTHQSLYKEYALMVEFPLSYLEFDKFIKLLMYKLSREIIVGVYEWKIPFSGGYLRISKNKKGFFFWYWDKSNSYCKLKKKLLWSFKPARGNYQDCLIGDKGLKCYYLQCKQDRKRPDYDVPIINHRRNR